MLASFAFIIPSHFTTVLYAVGAKDTATLDEKIRLTLKFSFIAGLLASGVILIGAHQVLSLFGTNYAEQAAWCLRILGLGVFPLILKQHYVAIRRTYGEVEGAVVVMTGGSAFELTFAGIGAKLGGLTGLSLGWLIAVYVEALVLLPSVRRMATYQAIARDQPGSEVSSSLPTR